MTVRRRDGEREEVTDGPTVHEERATRHKGEGERPSSERREGEGEGESEAARGEGDRRSDGARVERGGAVKAREGQGRSFAEGEGVWTVGGWAGQWALTKEGGVQFMGPKYSNFHGPEATASWA